MNTEIKFRTALCDHLDTKTAHWKKLQMNFAS